ncbi:actin-related protein 2/3 complex subunit 3 [Phlyctochytrium arcticum]|nr:actin-related protein 2/3 complex subunit 3 [Phlyctochytrium arcticum]
MPVYHSSFNDANASNRMVGNMAVLPFKTKIRGPAPPPADPTADDILDESLHLFRPNCLFRNFEIKGSADRVLIYALLFIQECLGKLTKLPNQTEGTKVLLTHALQNFAVPGEGGFPLNAMYEKPANRADTDAMRQYLSQLRQECATRLAARLYEGGADRPSKWWMCFSKRKFMGLPSVGTSV